MKNKPSYEAPKLTTFGSVERLTANNGCKNMSGPDDGYFIQGSGARLSDCS